MVPVLPWPPWTSSSSAAANPANFLDVGGTADAARVEKGFRIILKDPSVKAILVNIFGGIVRCDRVAQGVVDAYKNIGDIKVPIIVRLQGTNAVEAKELIDKSGLKVLSAVALQEAADRGEGGAEVDQKPNPTLPPLTATW